MQVATKKYIYSFYAFTYLWRILNNKVTCFAQKNYLLKKSKFKAHIEILGGVEKYKIHVI